MLTADRYRNFKIVPDKNPIQMFKLQIECGTKPKKVMFYNRDRSMYGEILMNELPGFMIGLLYERRKIYIYGRVSNDGELIIEQQRAILNGWW